jgi:PfaD family protein
MTVSFQHNRRPSGWWINKDIPLETGDQAIKAAISRVTEPLFLLNRNDQLAVAKSGTLRFDDFMSPESASSAESYPLVAYVPPLHPDCLGDPYFKKTHHLRYAYLIGAMANGISSVEMVEQAGHAGMLGFFGAAGLSIHEIETAIVKLRHIIPERPFGFNLIHSPNEPELESATVDLYLKRGINLVSASAYLDLTLPLVYFRVKGIHSDARNQIICPNKVIAKVSRIEVARKFFSPPPDKLLRQLVNLNMITDREATLANSIPMAHDLTAEADSGGHTDNQPAISLLPTMRALRQEMTEKFKYDRPLCVGLAGGIATPDSVAAAFAMGADYVLTGTINQACVEAGTSETVRCMLVEARQADVTMAPAADMFEMGVKVQVLKRGTMFPFRAAKLYDLYCRYDSLEEIPLDQITILERDFFRQSYQEEWEQTKAYFKQRAPTQIQRAESDSKHKMGLVFRSYLGRASSWANSGDTSRKIDYQIWCGPAMGAFNEWVRGTFLEKPENRTTITVAMNLLYGASMATRINWIRSQEVVLPSEIQKFSPLPLSKILKILGEQL